MSIKVYVLLRHHDIEIDGETTDARVLGVYSDREHAELARKRYLKGPNGYRAPYIAIVTKKILGAPPEVWLSNRKIRVTNKRLLAIFKGEFESLDDTKVGVIL